MKFPAGILLKLAITALLLLPAAAAQNLTSEQAFNARRTLSIGVVLFPGFEPLDVYGPVELLVSLSSLVKMTVAFVSFAPGPVNSRYTRFAAAPGAPPADFGAVLGTSTLATHAFTDAPALDAVLVPGGTGTRARVEHRDDPARGSGAVEDFLRGRAGRADYVLGVCTGSALLARAGLLDGRRATTNKAAWGWVTGPGSDHNPNVTWVPSARWVVDGRVWTSSGVAAGMDMAYAFAKQAYGADLADRAANIMEYAPHQDPDWDPFSVVHEVPGANMSESLTSCVKPAGY